MQSSPFLWVLRYLPIYDKGIKDATALLAEFEEASTSYDKASAEKREEIKKNHTMDFEIGRLLITQSLQTAWPTSFSSEGEKEKAYREQIPKTIAFVKEQRGNQLGDLDDLVKTVDEKTYITEIESWERDIKSALDPIKKENKQKAFYILKILLDREIMKDLMAKRS